MSEPSYLNRITTDPEICHGKPVVRGLRYPVQTLLELLASGMTFDEILDDYPDLEREDLIAALEFGAVMSGGSTLDCKALVCDVSSDPAALAQTHRRVTHLQTHPDDGQDFDELIATAKGRHAR